METEDWILQLARSTSGLREPKQRALKIIRTLKDREPIDIARFLKAILSSTSRRHSHLSRTHLDLVGHRRAFEGFGYEGLANIYAAANDQGWDNVKELLRPDRSKDNGDEEKPESFAKRLTSLTLGQRKSLSRTTKRRDLEVLVWDSDPLVIRELLLNPRITERDVVRAAARHKAPPKVLEEICRSDRWIPYYNVRKALVFNPRTPIAYSLGFFEHLRQKDVSLLLAGGTARKEIVKKARDKLQR